MDFYSGFTINYKPKILLGFQFALTDYFILYHATSKTANPFQQIRMRELCLFIDLSHYEEITIGKTLLSFSPHSDNTKPEQQKGLMMRETIELDYSLGECVAMSGS